jgi:hypothetical protein
MGDCEMFNLPGKNSRLRDQSQIQIGQKIQGWEINPSTYTNDINVLGNMG